MVEICGEVIKSSAELRSTKNQNTFYQSLSTIKQKGRKTGLFDKLFPVN